MKINFLKMLNFKILRNIIMMDRVYPFKSVYKALYFYLNNNPARQKYINHAEPERDSAESIACKMGGSPHDIHAAMTLAIKAVLKAAHRQKQRCFQYKWLTAESDCFDGSMERIAQLVGIKKYLAVKYIKQAEDDLLNEMIRRELINPNDAEFNFEESKKNANYH